MPPTKLQRHLDLIAYLVGRHLPVSVEELMGKIPAYAQKVIAGDDKSLASARRMFERDKDELRHAGIPIRTTRYKIEGEDVEGYEIRRRDFYLPYLKLIAGDPAKRKQYDARSRVAEVEIAQHDAPLALDALRRVAELPAFPFAADAKSAFRKLAFDLEPSAFKSGARVLFAEQAGAAELRARLDVVANAVLARKRLRFRYHGVYRGAESDREVAGYAVLFQGGHWYLIGRDATRDDVRVFRVGRMADVVANERALNTPDYEVPDDFDLQDYVDRRPWELGERDEEPLSVEVQFRFPQSLWAERNAYGRALRSNADGSSVRLFEVHQVNPFLRWILSQEGEAQISGPPELIDELRGLAQAIEGAHEGGYDARR